jgi:hypothetical protein
MSITQDAVARRAHEHGGRRIGLRSDDGSAALHGEHLPPYLICCGRFAHSGKSSHGPTFMSALQERR